MQADQLLCNDKMDWLDFCDCMNELDMANVGRIMAAWNDGDATEAGRLIFDHLNAYAVKAYSEDIAIALEKDNERDVFDHPARVGYCLG